MVNALVTSLSPEKTKESVFYGELTDGEAVIPLLGFDKSQLRKLEEFQLSQTPVSLKNCQITLNTTTGKPQVIKHYTVLEQSPPETHFHIEDPNTLASPILPVSQIETLEEYDRVTIKVTVIKVKDAQLVSKGKEKQEVIVADESGSISLTRWEQDIGKLTPNNAYQLN